MTIFPHEFAKNTAIANESKQQLYIGAAVAVGLLLIGGVIWWVIRNRRQNKLNPELKREKILTALIDEPELDYFVEQEMTVEKQLKKLLEQRPEDFSKVVRALLQDEEA